MLKPFKADLHIHSCLSPCADLNMSPIKIIHKAMMEKIEIIGICDHNSSENVVAFTKAAETKNIKVLPGMEVTSKEEVHILALFEKAESALKLQEIIYENLSGENDEEAFGTQVVANELDEVEGFNNKLLIGATELSVEDVVDFIHSFNGLAIASHVDREGFSIIGQLGFIPENLKLDALEISPKLSNIEARKIFNQYESFPFIFSSDAHKLEEIGKGVTSFLLKEPTLLEIKKALKSEEGRKVIN